MSPEAKDKLDAALQQVKSNRRDLLKRLLVASGTMTLLAPLTSVLAAGKSNADIKKCIDDKIKDEYSNVYDITAKVTDDGAVVLTGQAPAYAGAKGDVTKLARSCGAKKVTNNMEQLHPKGPGKPKASTSSCPPSAKNAGKCY